MSVPGSPTEPELPNLDPRPWRKRHPIFSRVLLFGIGGGLAALLLVLLQARQTEDRNARLRGIVQSFDILVALDGGPDRLLAKLDADFMDPGLPLDLRIAAARYRGMALRRKAQLGDSGAPFSKQIDAAFGQALRLAADRNTRNGLLLEWAEAKLAQDDLETARSALARGDFGREGPWAMLRDHYLAIAEALELGPEAGARRLEQILAGWSPPLPLEPRVEAGGRDWNLPQVATVTTERLARLYTQLGRDPLPLWNRLSLLVEHDAREQIICAKGLMHLGSMDDARRAWQRAVAADAQETAAWLENDRSLQPLSESFKN